MTLALAARSAAAILSALISATALAMSQEVGEICLNRFGPDPPRACPTGPAEEVKGLGVINPVPEFRWESTVFRIQIDGTSGNISCWKSSVIKDLPLGQKHKVEVWIGERRIQTFFFRFEDYGRSRLCLSFGPWYGTWQVEGVRPGTNLPCICRPSRNDGQ